MFDSFKFLGDQPVALLIGAVLLAVFQAAKFAELDIADPVTGRYIALLPGAKASDFTGRRTYHVSLAAFLAVSLALYYTVSMVSPEILKGAAKQFTGKAPDLEGIPYPLYVAAIFMGLTQPVLPGFAKIGDALRTFFHDRIEVPKRVVDISESLTAAIDVRSGADKRRLSKEVKALIDDAWLMRLDSCGDLAFYKMQLAGINLGDPSTAAKTLKEASPKELRDYIEKLVLFNLIAVMRKSGPRKLAQVAEWSRTRVPVAPPNIAGFLSGLILSGLFFGVLLAIIWVILNFLLGPVVAPNFDPSLWPDISVELSRIVPAIFICLLVAIYMLPPKPQGEHHRATPVSGLTLEALVDFARQYSSILMACFVVALLIHIFAEAVQYENAEQVKSLFSFTKLLVIFIRTAPSVALSYLALVYLSRQRAGQPAPFGLMMLAVIGVVALLALLVVLLFLHLDFLPAFPEYSGWDYAIFYVAANVLVSVAAFGTISIFFHSKTVAPKAMKALRTTLQRRRNAATRPARP